MKRLDSWKAEVAKILHRQSHDEGLWFRPVYATEDYLQSELRVLHAVLEKDPVIRKLCGLNKQGG